MYDCNGCAVVVHTQLLKCKLLFAFLVYDFDLFKSGELVLLANHISISSQFRKPNTYICSNKYFWLKCIINGIIQNNMTT